MRTAFIYELILQARQHSDIFLVVGDLGFSVVEPFAEEFPDRFLNVGVAEQNMTGIAAGLASEGYHVFTYSIANFPTLRCLEQIRNDVCYHNLPVTIVSVGAGLAYGNLGYSHHAIQDIGCLRGMPGITILGPADPGEAQESVRYLVNNPGPSYLRLGKAGEKRLHSPVPISASPELISGDKSSYIAVVATGSVLREAIAAAERVGKSTAVYSMPFLAPIKPDDIAALWMHKRVFVVEEHVRAGGLGELLSYYRPDGVQIIWAGLNSCAFDKVGSQDYLRHLHAISYEGLIEKLDNLHTL